MKQFCNNCKDWKESWADHPNYKTTNTYKRNERCWSCDQWTLSYRTIFLPHSSHLDRGLIQEILNEIKSGQASGLTVEKKNRNSVTGEYFRETVIYNGGATYTHITTDRWGCEKVEEKQLETIGDVMGILFLEAIENVFGVGILGQALIVAPLLCNIQ